MSYLDLYPEAVGSAGRSTATTSGSWASWASRSETRLRDAGGGARSSKVQAGFERYLSRYRPGLQRMATDTEALGNNAATAASTVDLADLDGSGILAIQAGQADQQATQLNRPINAAD